MEEKAVVQSSAGKPDLDWSQVRETVRMFCVGVSAIEYSMSAGDESISSLIETFTNMSRYMAELKMVARGVQHHVPDAFEEEYQAMVADLDVRCDNVTANLKTAVVSFQFYDRLTQQLDHISNSLEHTAELVGDQGRIYNPAEWDKLQKEVYSSFTMEEGRVLFDALMRGASKDEAILEAKEHSNKDADELELF
ncbi:MAG: hypothetical protein HON68_09415 [Gammaproteobacteria bacterium]|jgi:hypothetical protein|nr:hypothetical protein [Gammaproteobacteria bacterium]MBT3488301.1 hypothetical protein [Gammaproteobacteria bacterium]MBT3718401.1 hypothetical protein [Gammaproteobacteria bacterium]MBT3844840.1 hypothetical protein [Gammaproteobacteria bacterium]MBT3894344.1 hypothetical protein [Gammaproteobacteria bacterium]